MENLECLKDNKEESPFDNCSKQLTEEEIKKLLDDTELVSNFKQQKLEKDAKKNWDLFYKRNQDKFFKDRNWTVKEFSDLINSIQLMGDSMRFLEVGCGVGNFLWPLIKNGIRCHFYVCDFSDVALDLLRKNKLFNEEYCHVFKSDITQPDDLASKLPNSICFDISSLVFVLSAIHPDKMLIALKNIKKVLKKGGFLIFRDYGVYDHAMIRFSRGHKLSENFYVRQDGTRAYYFSLKFIEKLVCEAGFKILNLQYINRETVNIKKELNVQRVFIQGKFENPD